MQKLNNIRLLIIKFALLFKAKDYLINSNDKVLLWSFPETDDLMKRSFYQYYVQKSKHSKFHMFLLNIISVLPLIIFIHKKIENPLIFASRKDNKNKKPVALFISYKINLNILPKSIHEKYNVINIEKISLNGKFINIKDYDSILKEYVLHPYFLLKTFVKLNYISKLILEYKPSAIINMSEYSFTSSAITMMCRDNDIRHINIMHGDKVLTLIDAFFVFDEFYVWHQHYINLFDTLRSMSSLYIIDYPFTINNEGNSTGVKRDLVYILQTHTIVQMLRLRKILKKLKKENNSISIRLHPRYSFKTIILAIFYDFEIIDPRFESIEDTINSTNQICAINSTVLFQATHYNKEVIIDDISNPRVFNLLARSEYILFKLKHSVLSDLLKKI